MRTATWLAAVALLPGCATSSTDRTLTVGMPFERAASVLASAGAKPVAMDMIDETETERVESYDLPGGRVLVLVVAKSDGRVSKMEVCGNADRPKVERTWKSLPSIDLSKE
jgi:hypothetical protein